VIKFNKQIKILEIMEKEKCDWEEAVKREEERKSIKDFIQPM